MIFFNEYLVHIDEIVCKNSPDKNDKAKAFLEFPIICAVFLLL